MGLGLGKVASWETSFENFPKVHFCEFIHSVLQWSIHAQWLCLENFGYSIWKVHVKLPISVTLQNFGREGWIWKIKYYCMHRSLFTFEQFENYIQSVTMLRRAICWSFGLFLCVFINGTTCRCMSIFLLSVIEVKSYGSWFYDFTSKRNFYPFQIDLLRTSHQTRVWGEQWMTFLGNP